MMRVCPVCGKYQVIHWPEHWVYRRGDYYMCSERCLDVFVTREYKERTGWIEDYQRRKKDMRKKITLEQKKKAVEIAIGGGDPLEYLKDCGAGNPSASWWYIRKMLKEKEPELYAKLPAEKEEEEKVETVAEQAKELLKYMETQEGQEKLEKAIEELPGPYVMPEDTQEAAKDVVMEIKDHLEKPKRRPLNYEGFDVLTIKNEFGQFHYDAKFDLLDWTSPDGEEVSFSPDCWVIFTTEILPKAMAILGVDVKI